MLRIKTEETSRGLRFSLEGKLKGPWVAELERLYAAKKPVALDLEHLTGADEAGRYLLALVQRDGVALENANPLAAPLPFPGGVK
jgi:hypothetical protein